MRYPSVKAWRKRASELFGPTVADWRFVCPVCKHVQSVAEYQMAGAPESAVAFSCVGRWREGAGEAFGDRGDTSQGCNYAGGGLFAMNPVTVETLDGEMQVFAFDEPEDKS